MTTSTTAFIFPGQGSQIVGMGADIAAAYPVAKAVFDEADNLLGFSLSDLCFHGTQEALDETHNTQPALYVCSLAILRALQTEKPDLQPRCVAGHSLGEFTALTAADALNFADGLRLVRERGRLMREAGEAQPGAMAALLGLDADQAAVVCQQAQTQTGGVLVIANDNCPGQVVISGDNATLDLGLELAKSAGAKRAVKLAVSIAAHSPLMQAASEAFNAQVAATPFTAPRIPVYANVTVAPLTMVDDIRDELARQLTQTVRWTDSVRAMIAAGTTQFIEIGAKDVLTGLLKRIDRSAAGITINNLESFQRFING